MTLPDPARTRAVLIGNASGVKHMPDLADIPAVRANVLDLRQVLTDGTVWDLPPENCVTLLQPQSGEVVKRAVKEASLAAADTLLVYYAGHGLRAGSDDSLYLSLPHMEDPDEGLRYNDLASRLQPPTRKGPRTVVILDCCYADLADNGQMGGDGDSAFAVQTRIQGVCLLTAAAKTRKALAPEGERNTAFTSELLTVLREGDPQAPAFLDLDSIFSAVSRRLDERRRRQPRVPEPQLRTKDLGAHIILARNASHRGEPQPGEATPAARPPDMAGVVRACLRGRPDVPDLYVVQDASWKRKVQRAAGAHRLDEGEELVAVWVWSSWPFGPADSLALTSTGLRITDNGTTMYIPYEDFAGCTFDSDDKWDSSAFGHDDPRWWLMIRGSYSWTSKPLGNSAPEKMARHLRHIQTIVADGRIKGP
ncbi:caspase domain-containing protein [Streptomyces paradoxus]|uniref:caspase domain-containing protein n=1 Tax=Streptomyces paradoxus TaxID=66375 RepID=UPI0037D81FE8